MLAFIVPLGDDKIFGSLLFQKDKNFKVYVSEGDEISEEYRDRLPMVSLSCAILKKVPCPIRSL